MGITKNTSLSTRTSTETKTGTNTDQIKIKTNINIVQVKVVTKTRIERESMGMRKNPLMKRTKNTKVLARVKIKNIRVPVLAKTRAPVKISTIVPAVVARTRRKTEAVPAIGIRTNTVHLQGRTSTAVLQNIIAHLPPRTSIVLQVQRTRIRKKRRIDIRTRSLEIKVRTQGIKRGPSLLHILKTTEINQR